MIHVAVFSERVDSAAATHPAPQVGRADSFGATAGIPARHAKPNVGSRWQSRPPRKTPPPPGMLHVRRCASAVRASAPAHGAHEDAYASTNRRVRAPQARTQPSR